MQLIESVLSSLYGYWCTVFLLPKHLIKAVERFYSSFLWKSQAGKATGAKVNWALVCRPTLEGGLGLKRVADWNMARIARIIWLFFSGAESLWIA